MSARCPDCGLAAGDGGAWHRPFDGEEVRFLVDDLAPAERLGLTLALYDHDVPYRWDPGLVLVVRPEGAEVVRRRRVEPATGTDDGLEAEEVAEDDEPLLGALFDLADRLATRPWEVAALDELTALEERIRSGAPPYGLGVGAWTALMEEVGAVVATGDEADLEATRQAARALRAALRDYV